MFADLSDRHQSHLHGRALANGCARGMGGGRHVGIDLLDGRAPVLQVRGSVETELPPTPRDERAPSGAVNTPRPRKHNSFSGGCDRLLHDFSPHLPPSTGGCRVLLFHRLIRNPIMPHAAEETEVATIGPEDFAKIRLAVNVVDDLDAPAVKGVTWRIKIRDRGALENNRDRARP